MVLSETVAAAKTGLATLKALLSAKDVARAATVLADLGDHVVNLTEELSTATKRIAELERALEFRNTTIRIMGLFWERGDDHPYCPRCFEVDARPVHLKKPAWTCPQCKEKYPPTRAPLDTEWPPETA